MVGPNLEDLFPGLQGQLYQITSPRDGAYNCIAFAVGDNRNGWWPDLAEEDTWPAGVARVETVAAFRDAFATFGYAVCDHDLVEEGYEKIVLFALSGMPKHAAVCLGFRCPPSLPGATNAVGERKAVTQMSEFATLNCHRGELAMANQVMIPQ